MGQYETTMTLQKTGHFPPEIDEKASRKLVRETYGNAKGAAGMTGYVLHKITIFPILHKSAL